MTKILAPNKQYNGITAGVAFKEGVGKTSGPHLIRWFRSCGYNVKIQKPRRPVAKKKGE